MSVQAPDDRGIHALRAPGATVVATICWIGGIAIGHWCSRAEPWLIGGALAVAAAIAMAVRRRPRGARTWALVAITLLGAAWVILRTGYTQPTDLRQYISTQSQLAHLTGVVEDAPRPRDPAGGALARFSFRAPGSTWLLLVETIAVNGRQRPATGRLRVEMHQPEKPLDVGDHVDVTGWISAPPAPLNPGELDLRAALARQGITGYLNLRDRGECKLIAPAGPLARLSSLRQAISDHASASLSLGMAPDALRLELLDALLLGRRSPQPDNVGDSFRRVGLAHLLAISGAHLSILLGLTWLLARLLSPRPRLAALAVLLILGGYLLIVPPHVPIMRSGLMAALLALAYGAGRRTDPFRVLALSALLLLIWRPNDLFDAGFQLSFITVAAVLLFVPTLARRLWTRPMGAAGPDRPHEGAARRLADYLAFNVVASLFALPLVAYHFGVINPPGLGMSILSFPVVALVMGLGFIKIIVGWVFPSVGMLLARPLEAMASLMSAGVDHAAAWPGARVAMPHPPSALWTAAVLLFLTAAFSGWFFRRRLTLLAILGCCAAWLILPNLDFHSAGPARPAAPALQLTAFAVGDGSCFLLRCTDGPDSFAVMYDCGSEENTDLANRSIAPALRAIGVNRLDALVISHGELDGFSGSLDLLDHVPVGRVLTTRYVIDAAQDRPTGPAGTIIRALRERRVPIEPIASGWHERHAGAAFDCLWPPPDLILPHPNETCLVLGVRGAGRRVLLNGDIQQTAICGLIDGGADLHADVTDLPHHGSFVEASPRWLAAVSPAIVIQSAGAQRLNPDRWAGLIDPSHVSRLITERLGMIDVEIDHDGGMSWSAFQPRKP